MLAIVFGCQKFHDYLYGLLCVHIETDHKPLETILKKPLHTAPARLQRMIMSIQRYPISVSYRPGKELLIADTLSRSPLPDTAGEYEFHEYNINTLHTLPITESKLAEFKEQTKADPALQNLIKVVQTGWPNNKFNIPMETRPFWNYRDEITYDDGILFKGSKVIVPNSMHLSMLKLIHAAHLGAEKCKRRARDILFWPGMNAKIDDLVNSCTTCLTNKHRNTKEPLIPHYIPSRPWEKVGSDLFEFRGQHYLILVDYYSNFIEVDRLRQTTSEQVIEICKSQFARHGIPNEFISDNGPQFSSHKFHQFSSQYQFKHKTSSPYHPQSNGKAERAVQTIKSLLQRSILEKCDFHLALLEFRNTPSNDILGSPSQRLMGRRTRTLLPTAENLLLFKIIPPSQVQSELKKHQKTQSYYYNKQAKPLSSLQKGDKIMFQNGRTWLPATIAKATEYFRSYIIITPEGQLYRRNRKHLRPIPKKDVLEPESDSDDLDDYLTSLEGEPQETTINGTCEEQGREPSPPQLRRSKRKTARPYSYADPYTLRF
uniref:Integrase catalytic domain-containing protein n=2 Tax=Amphimedon queenslandica TaxID=400682 RepID=A0A1X7V5L8_AMPQE